MRAWLWKPFQEEPYGGDTVKKRFWAAVFLLATGLAQPLKVAILWHQHQPPYENPLTGQYEGPWVRMHGVNGYPWMAEVLLEFPEVKVSFDYTSTLLKQIQDYLSGKAKDAYWRVSEKPAGALTPEERAFVVERFFDINPRFVAESPRYQELQAKRNRGEAFTDLGVPVLSPETDRAMICGNLAFNLELKEMLESYGLNEGANSNPQQYVVEKAFLD